GMKAALFAVVSPLQYLNALEAARAWALRPEQCYLALGTSRKLPATERQLDRILDRSLWRHIAKVEGFPAPKGRNRLHSEFLAWNGSVRYASSANFIISTAQRDWGTIDLLFIGDYRPANFRHFIAQLPSSEVWILDDGSVTHQAVRYRKDRE